MNRKSRARRDFLKHTAINTVAGSGLLAMNGKLGLIGSALAANTDYSTLSDYKALVCVFLYGGSDSFNMFAPMDEAHFGSYTNARGSLGLGRNEFVTDSTGSVGFNAHLGALRDYYDAGKLAVVSNVGNLIRPVTKAEIISGSAQIPVDLFAHDHQQEQVQKAFSRKPQALVDGGWGGRIADLLASANTGSTLPPTFSLFGSNDFQNGEETIPVAINPSTGPTSMSYFDPSVSGTNNHARDATLRKILAAQSNHPLQKFARNSFQRARVSSRQLADALENSPRFNTPYNSSSSLASQLRMVARLIAAREDLGMKRQIFFVGMGGWDTHDEQAPRLHALTTELNESLASFQQTVDEMTESADPNLDQKITLFTQSDFGRSLTNNGGGSNHGWGGHYLVMGGAINGGQVIGDWPNYDIGGADDFNETGRVIPRISVNQFGAAMGEWMGLSASDLNDVFPDLSNFNSGLQSQYALFSA